MAFPESFLQELKMRNDITEVVSGYVNLKRRGRNMVGLCPFHGEKTPSFNVYTENGSFYCFGCGVGGDVISFEMKIENLDYVDAVKALAQRAGMEMPENSYDDSLSKLRSRVFEANREAARFYFSTLYSKSGAGGLEYFYSRGLSDRTIRHFGLGFADDNWTSLCSHLRSKGFKDNELVAANLAVQRRNGNGIYDRFTNRVMFPIIDLRGNVIAFGGRIMTDEKPKYLNTSDTPVFKKSANLFSLNNAKNSGSRTLILCEGYMDVIAVNQAGFTNAVATLGTALTSEQAVLMKRYADEVIICYDADEAGQKATARAIPILRNAGLVIRVLSIPSGKDPDEFIRSKGKDGPVAFKALLEKSGNDIEYRLQKLKQVHNTETTDGKVAFLEAASKVIATISSPIERDVYTSKICAELNVDKNAFKQQLSRLTGRAKRDSKKQEARKIQTDLSRRNDKINTDHYKKPRSSSAEEALVVYLVNNPDSASEISSKLKPEQFQNSLIRRYYEYILNRIIDGLDPLNNITADFSSDEASKLFQLMSQTIPSASTPQAMREYIEVINEESQKLSSDDISSMSPDQLRDYLERMKKNKQ
ncbi:MAG TPA: DNA primase [Ruminococcus sp.]|nr:DNA primase [Ruminococcus sp.]